MHGCIHLEDLLHRARLLTSLPGSFETSTMGVITISCTRMAMILESWGASCGVFLHELWMDLFRIFWKDTRDLRVI